MSTPKHILNQIKNEEISCCFFIIKSRECRTFLNVHLDATCCSVILAVYANINEAGIFPSVLL